MLQVSIYRFNPETDSEPYMQDLEVDTGGKDLMVLDVMELIKAQDTTFSYRRSCREGVCGSDGVNMNGVNGLACITPLSDRVKDNKLVLEEYFKGHKYKGLSDATRMQKEVYKKFWGSTPQTCGILSPSPVTNSWIRP